MKLFWMVFKDWHKNLIRSLICVYMFVPKKNKEEYVIRDLIFKDIWNLENTSLTLRTPLPQNSKLG